MLAENVTIKDHRSGEPIDFTLEAFAASIRGCQQNELHAEADTDETGRNVLTATWTCTASRPEETFIWTEGTRVVRI